MATRTNKPSVPSCSTSAAQTVPPCWRLEAESFLCDNLMFAGDGDMATAEAIAAAKVEQAVAAVDMLLALGLDRELLGPLVEILTCGGLAEARAEEHKAGALAAYMTKLGVNGHAAEYHA